MRLANTAAPMVVAVCCATSYAADQHVVDARISSVSCVSANGQRSECAADTSSGVLLLHQTSETNCLLGRNWGYDAHGVWVTEGCGGEFATGNTSRTLGGITTETASVEKAPVTKVHVEATTPPKSEMDTVTTGVNPELHYTGFFNPYGSLRVMAASSPSGAQVQDDASRIGINFTTMGPVKVFGTAEWGVNLVAATTLTAGAVTTGGFGEVNTENQPIFGPRLGFFGVDFNKFGRLSFGKQNATHYDIASYTTDRFNVFGGQSTATYVAGTDGGQSGTGRVDQAILYHLKFAKIVDFGAQAQLRNAATLQAFNGFGFSLQGAVLPGLTIGGAYNKAYFSPADTERFFNGGGTDYWSVGGKGQWRIFEWGANWVRQHNGDLAFIPNSEGNRIGVGFSANGVELFSKLNFGQFAAIVGFDDYMPIDLNPVIHPDFKTRYAVLGAEYHFSKSGYTFFESRVGDSIDATGHGLDNAAAIGVRYDFSVKTPHVQ